MVYYLNYDSKFDCFVEWNYLKTVIFYYGLQCFQQKSQRIESDLVNSEDNGPDRSNFCSFSTQSKIIAPASGLSDFLYRVFFTDIQLQGGCRLILFLHLLQEKFNLLLPQNWLLKGAEIAHFFLRFIALKCCSSFPITEKYLKLRWIFFRIQHSVYEEQRSEFNCLKNWNVVTL